MSEERRCEINRIFDLEYRLAPPASEASLDDLVEEYGAKYIKGSKCGVYDLLRYWGDDPKPCRTRTSPITCGRWHRP